MKLTILKVFKGLYVHPLTLALIAVCYITRTLESFLITYFIMIVHELAHFLAAVFIGLKPSHIILYPFGVNLRLKNKIICSLSDEIILYFAGPFLNIILALLALLIKTKLNSVYLNDFYINNIALFIINMLPILPLDGGVILKKLMMYRYGYKKSQNIMIAVSVFFVLMLIGISGYLIYKNSFNISLIIMILFMSGNIFTQREKYNIDFIKEIIFYKDKKYNDKTIKLCVANKDENLSNISLKFNMQNYYIVFIINNSGKIEDILTETEILNSLVGRIY